MFAAQVRLGASVIDGFYGKADRLESMADYALARMPPTAAILGHSMGARVALEIVRRAPHRLTRLALVDTGIHPVRAGEEIGRYRLRDLGFAQGAAALADAWLPPMLAEDSRRDGALMDTLREMVIAAGPTVFARQIEALLHRPAVEQLLPTIAGPTLVAVGSEDMWSPPEQHEAITRLLPDGHLRVIAGAGHMAPAERPEAFNEIVRDWLSWPARSGETEAEAQKG
ncbi:alpha/beta hydrolase [Sphingomonas sp.]|uniref:alpha/beta fold hydrolase n=1 Tax=Sphingomonas sp. TaxID=28214 RepID=UPI0031D67F95